MQLSAWMWSRAARVRWFFVGVLSPAIPPSSPGVSCIAVGHCDNSLVGRLPPQSGRQCAGILPFG